MRLHHAVLSAVLASLLVCGCKTHKPPAAVPADESTLKQVRDSYTRIDPTAKVGRVIAVLPESSLVAVGDINPADVQVADVMVFVNTNQQIIAVGYVVDKTANAIHLNYDVKADGRAPVVGDLAVKARL